VASIRATHSKCSASQHIQFSLPAARVSSPGELPPQALSEPYVNLSIHTAPSVQPPKQLGDLLVPKAHPPKSWPCQG
jgi:hypothetical protein